MLTNISDIKSLDELIVEKETLCAELEAGNPFLNNQEFIFSQTADDDIDQKEACKMASETILSEHISKLLNNNLRVSLNRARRNPRNPALGNEAALGYLKNGNIEEAIDGFKKVLSIEKDYFPAIANLAKCYSIKGDVDKALKIYEGLERLNHDDVRFLSNIALLHFRKKDFNMALQYLKRAVNFDSENYSLLNNLGLVYLAKRNISNAISLIRKAVKIENKEYIAYNNLGVCYLALNNFQKALHYFKIAYRLNRSARDVIQNITNTYHRIGDHNSVIELLDEYMRINPEDIELGNLLCWSYFELGEYNKCIKRLKQSLNYTKEEDTDKIASLYNNIAVVFEKIADKRQAIKFYSKCMEVKPNADLIVFNNIIGFFFENYPLKDTKVLIDGAMEVHPDNPIILNYLGKFYEESHQYKNAKDIYYRVLQIDEKIIAPYLRISSIDMDVFDNISDALRVMEKGLAILPESIALINNYAYCQLLIGNISKAKEYLAKVENVEDIYLSATRGLLSIKEGNVLEGTKLYNRAAFLTKRNKDLEARVNQKKFLELGKHYLEVGDNKKAVRLLEKGLKFKSKVKYFENKIIELLIEVRSLK